MLLTNLKAATMVGGYGLIADAAILIEGSRIAWVGPRSQAPSGHEATDCEGRLATPGLIDRLRQAVEALQRDGAINRLYQQALEGFGDARMPA